MSKKKVRINPNAQIMIERCNGRLSLRGGSSGVLVYESKRGVDIEQFGDDAQDNMLGHDMSSSSVSLRLPLSNNSTPTAAVNTTIGNST